MLLEPGTAFILLLTFLSFTGVQVAERDSTVWLTQEQCQSYLRSPQMQFLVARIEHRTGKRVRVRPSCARARRKV
jgi:hypothetical protein